MSKSIAIIDTPESCILCPFCHYNKVYGIYECRRERSWREITDYNQKPDWCSLIPVSGLYMNLPEVITCPLSPLPEENLFLKEKKDEKDHM